MKLNWTGIGSLSLTSQNQLDWTHSKDDTAIRIVVRESTTCLLVQRLEIQRGRSRRESILGV